MKLLYFLVIFFVAVAFCEARDPKCLQPTDAGVCYGYVPMYTFNIISERCEQFVYGGCMGNDNKFSTLEECHAAC